MSNTRFASDAETSRLLQTFDFDGTTFEALRQRFVRGELSAASNAIRGTVEPPREGDVQRLPPVGSSAREKLAERGREAIARGEVGAVILAGGMATRFGGVVKAAVKVLGDRSFLDLKLADVARAAERAGGTVPAFLMTSFATHDTVKELAAPHATKAMPVECFSQFISVRLTPSGGVFVGADGRPSLYAPGHGDLTFALRRSGVLARFLAGGGRTLFMSNVDNLTATLDPAVIGAHLEGGAAVTAEVADKAPGDKGGAPARVDGALQIVEGFRFPASFDQDRISVFNTNTLALDARAIDRDFDLDWFVVEKNVDGSPAIQFERLVGQLTAFLPSRFLRVERSGLDARFQPVTTPDDLPTEAPVIEAALRARGAI